MPGPQNLDPENEPLRLHFQARLHGDTDDGGREYDALEFYFNTLVAKEKWGTRRTLREALIALRMYWEEGYRPPDVKASVITEEMVEMVREARKSLELVRKHVEMLQNLDLSSLRTQDGWNEEVWQQTSTAVNSGAAAIMGHAKSYDEDDDDE